MEALDAVTDPEDDTSDDKVAEEAAIKVVELSTIVLSAESKVVVARVVSVGMTDVVVVMVVAAKISSVGLASCFVVSVK